MKNKAAIPVATAAALGIILLARTLTADRLTNVPAQGQMLTVGGKLKPPYEVGVIDE